MRIATLFLSLLFATTLAAQFPPGHIPLLGNGPPAYTPGGSQFYVDTSTVTPSLYFYIAGAWGELEFATTGGGSTVNRTYDSVGYEATKTLTHDPGQPNFVLALTGNIILDVDGPPGAEGYVSLIRDPNGDGTEAITLTGIPPWNDQYPEVAGGEVLLKYVISPGGLNWEYRGEQVYDEIVTNRLTLRNPDGSLNDAYFEVVADETNASLKALYVVPPQGARTFWGNQSDPSGDLDFRHAGMMNEIDYAIIGNMFIGKSTPFAPYIARNNQRMDIGAEGDVRVLPAGTLATTFANDGVNVLGPLTVDGVGVTSDPATVNVSTSATSQAVTFATARADANYTPVISPYFSTGGWWISAQTATGFTLNWATQTTGAETFRYTIKDE